VEIKNPIVFGALARISASRGRGNLGVMSDFDPIERKFGMQVKIDILNNILKLGCDQLVSDIAHTRTKKFS